MQRLLPVQHSLGLHILLQGNAVDQLHDNVKDIVSGGNVEDLDDVRVAEHGNGLALRPEAAAEFVVAGIFILQNFYGHQPVQPVTAGLVYHGHAAGADDLQ